MPAELSPLVWTGIYKPRGWVGTIAFLNRPSNDGRVITTPAPDWAARLPCPLTAWVGHERVGAALMVVGAIERAEIVNGHLTTSGITRCWSIPPGTHVTADLTLGDVHAELDADGTPVRWTVTGWQLRGAQLTTAKHAAWPEATVSSVS